MPNPRDLYESIQTKMENAGFEYEREQIPYLQSRRKTELKFINTRLVQKLVENGHRVRAKKFYIKPLSNNPHCEIGFVTGKTSPLLSAECFSKPNTIDSFDGTPAWTNKDNDGALDSLLKSITDYLNS